MSNQRWFFAALASLVLVGCTGMQVLQVPPADECTTANCRMEVTVTDCTISVSPPTLRVKLPRGEKKMVWDLVSDDYMFSVNGIVIKNPAGQFDKPNLSAGGKQFKLRNKHTVAGDYNYTVSVVKTGDDPKICTLDPVIANE